MYFKIFEEIVSITHNDYSGFEDKKGWDNPEKYRAVIKEMEKNNNLDSGKFHAIVEDYLLDFKDRHLYFRLIDDEEKHIYDNGFQVRRFEDKLYVTQTMEEDRVDIGDAILALDEIPIDILADIHMRDLLEEIPERENWQPILSKYSQCKIESVDGNRKTFKLGKYRKFHPTPQYTVERINDNTLLMTLPSFSNAKVVSELINEYEKELQKTENLIVDVRENGGGSDVAFKDVLPYLFPEGETTFTLEEAVQSFNCTQRNYELTASAFQKFLSSVDDPEIKENLDSYIDKLEANIGRGFIVLDEDPPPLSIEGKTYPKQIVALTDVNCASAAEGFIEYCKKSTKVTVMGRPTAGVNDYSNLVFKEWDRRFELWYPTSKLVGIESRNDVKSTKGINPDVYIPWTTEHINKDIDVRKALEYIEKQKDNLKE